MADDSEWMKLPTEEKVQHKAWKARIAGYEEVTKLFQRLGDEKSPEFSRYAGLLKKFVTDSNAFAQEKGLEATQAFVENAAIAPKTAHDVVSGIITKCLNSTKQKTKDLGKEVIMLYVEAEKQDIVEEDLIEGLANKNPKVVIGCIACLREGLRDFGNKIIQIKPMVKYLPKLIEDRDKNVREETKQLIVEIYRWIGAAIKPKLADLKPVQVTELEAEFERLGGEKAHQVRFLKSQQDLKAKMEEKQAAGDDGGEEEGDDEGGGGAEAVDPYDLLDPVNILPLLPKDFYDKVEAKKWQERREALEALQKLCDNPKIEPGDFGPVVKVLQKVIAKDTNVMLVALGGKCLAGLANGLRKKFSTYSPSCFSVILDKFKEKKQMVVTALRDASDACYQSINLEVIMDDVLAALENKNPSIKAETALFLGRCFCKLTMASLPKKQLKAFCTALLKTVNDTAPDVREASFDALGTAMKVVSEKNIALFLTDVDNIKMQKIKDSCEKAVLLNAKGEPRSGGGGGAKPAGPRAGSAQPKPVARPTDKPQASGGERPKTAPAKPGGPPRAGAKKGGPAKGKAAAKKGSAGPQEKTEKILSDDEFLEKATDLLTAEVLGQLENSNWKERLAGMEKFTQLVKGMSPNEVPCQICVRAVNKKPGLKETNFQVMKVRVDLVCYLAQNAQFTNTTAEFILGDLVDKVGDVKNGSGCQEALSCIAEATSLEYVSSQVLKLAFNQKNPKNQSESLNWLAKALTEFGLKIQLKQNIEYIKKAFSATNPAVRTAALGLLPVLYMHMGPQLRMFFEDEKAALLQQIDAEFEKVKGQKPPAPIRGVKSGGDDNADDQDEADTADTEEASVVDLVPRNDIGDRFSQDLINNMADKNWKVRGEALQNVISILNEAKFITGNLGPLPEAIKARLGDANKNLVTTTIGICVTLATNMGPHCKAHVKTIGPSLITCLGDSKPMLRSAAIGALNAWVDQTTLTPLVECESLSDGLKLENPNLRQELLGWLIERLPNHKQLPKDEMKMCIPHLLTCLEDRNADVRKKAQEALVPFMIHVGYDAVFRATSKLKPASKDQITAIIEKARENLPAKQPPKAKKAQAAPAKSVAKSMSPDQEDELDLGKKQKAPTEDSSDAKTTKAPGKTKAKAPAAPSKRKKVEEDTSPPISVTVTKAQRMKDEKNLKVLKWNFTEPRLEFVEQLKLQMEKNFSTSMMANLFHSDFKFHIKAIETLIKCLPELQNEQIANLDVILKWFTLRFFDTNPSMLNKGLEYLQALFTVLCDVDYQLQDSEAHAFIPYLVIKVGENKDNVRRDVRQIFKLIYKVYPASKMFTFISDGIKSKNSKQRTECLEELGYLIETYGITICQPTPGAALKIIAGQISDRDNSVRNAALNSTVVAYLILGDNLYKYIGTLREKDQSYLDERIKRSSKKAPAPAEPQRPKTAPQQNRTSSQPAAQRPHTAMPKSASANSMKKQIHLDIEDEDKPSKMDMPQLIQHSDLDELLQQPVQLPKINARAPSPGPRFMNTADTANTINFVISQVTNREISTCVEALAQIDEVIKDRDKVLVMTDHVEQLLVAMSMQFKIVYTTHMGDIDRPKEDVIRLYRILLGTLLSLFQNTMLATQASKDILKELINNLVTVLLDNRLNELDDGPQIVRSVNVLVVKIVEKSDQTNVLCALIRLLQECAESETCSNKFLELNMKCLWKMVRMFPDMINELNLDKVLCDIHQFLVKFPSHSWKERSNDLPLRTVKTILHSLAKLKGSKILSHLEHIDAGEVSEVKGYLQKVLKNEGNLGTESEMNGTDDNRAPRNSSKSKRLSKTTHDLLTEIFKKVGSKENTKEGLQDLYNFKKKYPEADLEPYLKKSSHFFQNYIERGLKAIEMEQNEKNIGGSVNDGERTAVQPLSERSSSDSVIDTSRVSKDGDSQFPNYLESSRKLAQNIGVDADKLPNPPPGAEADYFMERLRKLRAKCGLDSNNKEEEEQEEPPSEPVKFEIGQEPPPPTSQPDIMKMESSEPNIQEQNAAKSTDVSKLKERLERIKQMANS